MRLFKHQKLALAYMRMNNYFALFMEQGTMKTLPALVRILEILEKDENNNALVICPKYVMGSWERDIEGKDDEGRLFFNERQQRILKTRLKIVNYDLVWRRKEYDKHCSVIVLDESHFIKNRTSRRAKFCLKLALKSDYRYILTGTPIGNGQMENIWSQFAFLSPYKYSRGIGSNILGTYRQFEDKYCILNQYWKPYRYRNVTELQNIIDQYSYRVTKNDVLDIPGKLPDEIFEIEIQEKQLYKELHKHSVVEKLDMIAENPLAKMTKLRQICSGFLNDDERNLHELKCEKYKVLEDFLDGYEKKLVIFCEFKQSIKKIGKILNKKKIKYVILDGEQKDKNVWRKFQKDNSIQIIICQYQSGAQGIDLFASDTILYFEPTLSSNILEQSRDRIDRKGQTRKCSYIFFLTKGTIEMNIYRALKNYSDFNKKLFKNYINEYWKGGKVK